MSTMPPGLRTLATLGAQDQILAGIVLLSLAALLALAGRAAWRVLGKHQADALLTFAAATLTSAVVATGMWHFAGERLHFTGLERWLLFAILEITMVTCAVRARRLILETGGAGPEGVVIWLVSVASGAFGATTATSAPEAAFRLLLPLLATWLWERSLLPARREAGKQSRWRAMLERAMARLGIGALDLTADADAAAQWRIAQLARAVVHAKRAGVHAGARSWHLRRRWLRWRVDVLTIAANERAELATRQDRRDLLLAYISTQLGSGSLIALAPPAPWDAPALKRAWKASQAMPEDIPPVVPEVAPAVQPEHASRNAGDIPGPVPEARPQVPPKPALKLSASKSRGMSPAQLVPHVLAMLGTYETVSVPRVKADLHVGTDKAAEALRLARAEHGATVTPIDRAARG